MNKICTIVIHPDPEKVMVVGPDSKMAGGLWNAEGVMNAALRTVTRNPHGWAASPGEIHIAARMVRERALSYLISDRAVSIDSSEDFSNAFIALRPSSLNDLTLCLMHLNGLASLRGASYRLFLFLAGEHSPDSRTRSSMDWDEAASIADASDGANEPGSRISLHHVPWSESGRLTLGTFLTNLAPQL